MFFVFFLDSLVSHQYSVSADIQLVSKFSYLNQYLEGKNGNISNYDHCEGGGHLPPLLRLFYHFIVYGKLTASNIVCSID